MCPACISAATWLILGSTSASGMLAGVVFKLRGVAAGDDPPQNIGAAASANPVPADRLQSTPGR